MSFNTLVFAFFTIFFFSVTEAKSFTDNPTILESFQENVLKRRTRSVIFPDKGMVLLTLAFTKAILDGIPRGLIYSIEFDMYHTLPDTIDGWKPTLLIKKIEKGHQSELKPETGNAAPLKAGSDLSAPLNEDFKQSDYNFESDMDSYHLPVQEYKIDRFDGNVIESKADYRITDFARRNPQTQYRINPVERNFHSYPYGKNQEFHSYSENYDPVRSEFFENIQPVEELPSWYYHQNYRERRQIYDQLETVGQILNLNIKACIQRAMCEMTTYLKPYGESLIDDVIRIMLTIPKLPLNNSVEDDYNERYESVNCAVRFASSCPYQVIDFIKKNLKK